MSATTGFFHGVKTNQLPTAIVPPRTIMSALPIVFGCAPIHRLPAEMRAAVMPGKVVMVYDVAEAGARFGIDVQRDDFEHWTLSEMTYTYFMLFSVAPAVFANLFDPEKHRKNIVAEPISFVGGKGRLINPDLVELPVMADHYGYLSAAASVKDRNARNRELLLQELGRNPEDAYYRYQLGKNYNYAGEKESALAAMTWSRAKRRAFPS